MTFLASDLIRVFVSSRLVECADERIAAKEAIASLNHEPVMFEMAGARPHGPRSIYLRGLDESLIFVGIYREGYGYIADGMQISGLEDEYQYAKSLGIPQLLYVKQDARMDPRLQSLVKDFTRPNITVATYTEPASLRQRIRDDVAALVADYFRRGRSNRELEPPSPETFAAALVPKSKRVRRQAVVDLLTAALDAKPVLMVTGPLGIGKSVFISILAEEQGWAYAQCGGRSSVEILSDAANTVRRVVGLPIKSYLQTDEARKSLYAAWNACSHVTLVLEDVREVELVRDVMSTITATASRQLIITSRSPLNIAAGSFELPPFSLDEVSSFVSRNRLTALLPGELEELHRLSKGNPLYLRYYVAAQPRQFESDLGAYELGVWNAITPDAREALSYLALVGRPLTLAELSELLERRDSIETLVDRLVSARSLLVESARGYSIFHPHASQTIRASIAVSKQRLAFYARRLSKWFSTKRDYTAAFAVLHAAGLTIPLRLLALAGRHASMRGDATAAIEILTLQLESVRFEENPARERDILLALAQMQATSGDIDGALALLAKARKIPAADPPVVDFDEFDASLRGLRGEASALRTLMSAKTSHLDAGREWEAARVAIEISAFHIRRRDPEAAIPEARFALEIFEKVQDHYGIRTAKLNLFSAFSATDDHTKEAVALRAELESEADDSPRNRVIVCNALSRIARRRNDTAAAKEYASEAIEIGRKLGDVSVVANNLINLGNAFRQEADLRSAFAHYEAADKVAREAGLVLSEAAAQELLASVLNQRGDGARALHHATYAISLVKDGGSPEVECAATEELAEACELLNDDVGAIRAWLQHAKLEIGLSGNSEDGSYPFRRAVRLVRKNGSSDRYREAYLTLFDGPFLDDENLSIRELLMADIGAVCRAVSLTSLLDIAAYHARFVFDTIPRPVARRALRTMMASLLALPSGELGSEKKLRAAIAITMALPPGTLTLNDVAFVGRAISKYCELSFRASPDGTPHWGIEIALGRPVFISISQIDDNPDVAIVTLCIALVLASYAPDVYSEVLAGTSVVRSEGDVQVMNYDEAKKHLPLAAAGLSSLDGSSAVTRATDAKTDVSVPILVFVSTDLTKEWLVGEGKGNAGQVLFAQVLVELLYHLQAGEIELEALYPKVVELVKKTVV